MYVSEAWSGDRPRRLLGLLVGALYVVLLAVPFLRDYTAEAATPWIIGAAIVGLVVLGTAVYSFIKARNWKTGILEALPALILLLTPVPYMLGWQPEIGLVFVLVAFLLKIRDLARGHAMVFSIIAILGILVISSVFMADVEQEAGQSRMQHWWQAMFWGAGQIFRFHRSVGMYSPKTDLGNWIGIAVVAAGVLFSAVLLSALTSWAVNSSRKKKDAKSDDKMIAKAVDAAVQRAIGAVLGPEAAAAIATAQAHEESEPSAQQGEQRVWIDVDHIVGSRPLGWWESRRVSVPAYVAELRASRQSSWPRVDEGMRPLLIPIVEGSGCAEPEGESTTAAGVRMIVVHAEGTADAEILERVREGDVVVTDRPGLAEALLERDVKVASPQTLVVATA